MKLKNPTVKDVIAALQSLPPDVLFCVEDPDTSWIIDTFFLDEGGGRVWLSADYCDMKSGYRYDIDPGHRNFV